MRTWKHSMVVLVLLAGLAAMISMAGCSGLQASAVWAKSIQSKGVEAQAQLATPPDALTAKLQLRANADLLREWHEISTINYLAYLFDPNKHIWCTARIYSLMEREAVRAEAYAAMTWKDGHTHYEGLSDAAAIELLRGQNERFVERARQLAGTE
jgi:hypothetical protein